jgi:hypothetical protein
VSPELLANYLQEFSRLVIVVEEKAIKRAVLETEMRGNSENGAAPLTFWKNREVGILVDVEKGPEPFQTIAIVECLTDDVCKLEPSRIGAATD